MMKWDKIAILQILTVFGSLTRWRYKRKGGRGVESVGPSITVIPPVNLPNSHLPNQ